MTSRRPSSRRSAALRSFEAKALRSAAAPGFAMAGGGNRDLFSQPVNAAAGCVPHWHDAHSVAQPP